MNNFKEYLEFTDRQLVTSSVIFSLISEKLLMYSRARWEIMHAFSSYEFQDIAFRSV